MKRAAEVRLGAMIYIPSFIKNGSGIKLLSFFQNKGSRLKTRNSGKN
jgi:hypothetical protein